MGIYLENNPIQNVPIHIIEQGKIAIKEWFVQQEKYGKEKAYIAKIVVVGEPEAGKTSLVKKLFDENHLIPSSQAEISTLGVEVKTELKFPYSLDNSIQIDCNVWDFGGQDIQYALHQYFISPDALYILVSDYRSEKARFNYWFQTINLLASEESKVIVLLNKFKNATTTNSFDITPYKRDFSKLQISLVEVDLSQTDDKWEHLKSEIAFQLSKLKIVGQEIIKIYTPIKAKITEKIKEGNNYISLEELYKLTEIEGMTDETDIQYMLKYFHESGFLLYFNEDDSLKDYVFLNPNWVTNGIYAALSDEISKNKGRFTKEWIEEFWKTKGYKKYESSKLLNLMKKDKFDICYPLPQNENEFITPMLLPEKEPDINWDYENNVQIRYSYDSFMPEGIISQIIVKLHQLICNENGEYLVWRNGVVLERENAKAFIVKHTNNKEIYIRLKGNQIIELRAIIIESLHSIISRFTKQPEIRIPCNCEKCKSSSEPTFFDYSFLKQEKDNNGEVAGFCTKTKQIIRVDDVLEGIGIPKYQQQKVVFNYLATSNAEQFIKDFFELFKKDLVSRFSKNMNESTYHVVIHSWLKMFAPKDYKIKMEMNLLGGECDLMVESTTNNKINDIFEFKYLPKKATNNRFDNELEEAKKQVKKYLQGDYENYRGIAVVFRALEDYKIDYVTN